MTFFNLVWKCGTCEQPILETWKAVIKNGRVHHAEHYRDMKPAKLPRVLAR